MTTPTANFLKRHVDSCEPEATNVYSLLTKRRLVMCSCGRKIWAKPLDMRSAGM